MPRASFISMRHAGGVPVLALPSRFGVDPILPCPPRSRQPSERRAPKGTISALGGTLSTPLNATMSVGRHLVRLRAENWPRLVLTVTSLGPCSPGTTGLSLMIAWLCASRSKIPPSRYPLKAYTRTRRRIARPSPVAFYLWWSPKRSVVCRAVALWYWPGEDNAKLCVM